MPWHKGLAARPFFPFGPFRRFRPFGAFRHAICPLVFDAPTVTEFHMALLRPKCSRKGNSSGQEPDPLSEGPRPDGHSVGGATHLFGNSAAHAHRPETEPNLGHADPGTDFPRRKPVPLHGRNSECPPRPDPHR